MATGSDAAVLSLWYFDIVAEFNQDLSGAPSGQIYSNYEGVLVLSGRENSNRSRAKIPAKPEE